MIDREYARGVLEDFLSFPLESSVEILERFASLPNAIYHNDSQKCNFVYVPGNRQDRALLIAHCDTVWDKEYFNYGEINQTVKCESGSYSGVKENFGIGADDRAGCAMLWLLKDSGHSLLITDGEESGRIGAFHIKEKYPEIFEELNQHSYMVQLDRRNSRDYKCYRIPVTDEFKSFIEAETQFVDAGVTAFTDIVTLCYKICGVNLSVGYYNEHSSSEILVFDEWYHTLDTIDSMLYKSQKRFLLQNI